MCVCVCVCMSVRAHVHVHACMYIVICKVTIVKIRIFFITMLNFLVFCVGLRVCMNIYMYMIYQYLYIYGCVALVLAAHEVD
jgi:hypothetical protein